MYRRRLKNLILCVSGVTVASTVLSSRTIDAAEAADGRVLPSEVELRAAGIEPNARKLREFLDAMVPGAEEVARQQELFRQLGDPDYHRRERAFGELLQTTLVARDVLQQAVDSDDVEARWRAHRILAAADRQPSAVRNRRTLRAVLATIELRAIAGLAESVLRVAPLCREPPLSRRFVNALRKTATAADAHLLRDAALRGDEFRRIAALRSLATVLADDAEPELRAALADDSQRIVAEAAWLLVNRGERLALPVLVRLLDADDLHVRIQAAHALRETTGRYFGYAACDPPGARQVAVKSWKNWLAEHHDSVDLRFPILLTEPLIGRTLICFRESGRVVEFDMRGEVVWEVEIQQPSDCQGLPNGHRLVTSYSKRAVFEYDAAGNLVWQREGLRGRPFSGRRLPSGNTLVTGTTTQLVAEFSADSTAHWRQIVSGEPMDARRLENGNTLIALQKGNRVIEIEPDGTVVWTFPSRVPRAAERLSNGNTLTVETGAGRVVEVDFTGQIVWQRGGFTMPMDAQRLSNGHTLVAEHRGAVELNPQGEVVWIRRGNDISALCRY